MYTPPVLTNRTESTVDQLIATYRTECAMYGEPRAYRRYLERLGYTPAQADTIAEARS